MTWLLLPGLVVTTIALYRARECRRKAYLEKLSRTVMERRRTTADRPRKANVSINTLTRMDTAASNIPLTAA